MLALSFGIGLGLQTFSASTTTKAPATVTKTAPATATPKTVNVVKSESVLPYTNALTIVANPTKYLNKKVKIKAKFDKFSVLGLDYKPAFRSSEKYITFLIKRDDVVNNVVPLSEMKNFMLRSTAEKFIDLKPNDIIEYTGTVFSDALSDTWIEVDSFKVLQSSAEKKAQTSSK